MTRLFGILTLAAGVAGCVAAQPYSGYPADGYGPGYYAPGPSIGVGVGGGSYGGGVGVGIGVGF
ncbi:hypothetical protein GCT13_36600 [Paraburkholderia sp. CNPSo 3157]|uniref:Lipoprotein n=1 Tax=Paraburkholderia franconis TaxID=2654983 RepID=A0A7X1NIE3_9BURK|nr:hypothetical protein [Paraburkholderia franconis]MPW22206.1 hypothetical protein [Paraburkholderia franconis]